MPKRHRDFSVGTKISEYEPITFTLNEQEFTCKPAVQGSVLLEFVASADGENGGAAATAIHGFFKDVMEEDEYKRFSDELHNPEVIYDMEAIGEIAAWLVEEYSARPTKAPASSSNGRRSSGRTSTAKAS